MPTLEVPTLAPPCTCTLRGGLLTTPCPAGRRLQEALIASLDRSKAEYDAALREYSAHLRTVAG